jgi:hypothetical protein
VAGSAAPMAAGRRVSTSARVLRELLALPSNSACVDAMTPELRQRIAAASRLRIASLLPNLR